MKNYDVAIIGGGIVGITTALLMAHESSLRIALFEQNPLFFHFQKEKYAERTSAISMGSENIFRHLSCFSEMEKKRIAPFDKMHVWDVSGRGEIDFHASDMDAKYLGFMIEDSVMRDVLLEKLQNSAIDIFSPCHLNAIQKKESIIELQYDEGCMIETKLLVGADGANSWVRATLGIPFKSLDYNQTAIIANVKTEFPHENTARQRFLKNGPLAFLPLDDPYVCSIVWSIKNTIVQELLNDSDEVFKEKLAKAFQYRLGKVTEILSARKHFPLRMRHVDHYVEDRVALVGDAAHTLHPLAGQGVNLGLQDAATLAEVVKNAHQKKRDFFSFATLRRYERARKSDTALMIATVSMLNQLFSNDVALLRVFRNTGLKTTNQMSWLKKILARYAVGRDHAIKQDGYL